MKKDIKLIELFSGIGGFAKGLSDAGFNIIKHYFSEVNKHPIANYKYNFPNAEYIGSVTDISGRDFTGIDIITFGSPCQDFSLAGKREGMDGQRSVLILEAIRLVTELRPPVFIWENVKGAFSSNSGADFWGILQAFANIGGYRLEWQLLNTKWFLPQNRERIYLVGHLAGSERSFGNVFPISEDVSRGNERLFKATNIRTLTAGGNSGGLHASMSLINYGNSRLNKTLKQNREPLNNSIIDSYNSTYHTENSPTISTRVNDSNLMHVYQIGTWRDFKGEVGLREMDDNLCPTLLARARADGSGQPAIKNENSIRRLTEIECERLQGFPDDWTKFGIYEKQVWTNKKEGTFEIVQNVHEIPKTQRYKMLGNAVTVKIVEEIGKRLLQ